MREWEGRGGEEIGTKIKCWNGKEEKVRDWEERACEGMEGKRR